MALTLAEVNDRHGGVLPAGETFAPDDPADTTPKPKGKPKGRPPPSGRKERWAMFNAFTDFHMARLKPAEVAVWLILFRDTKRDTGTACTGRADLARRAGCSRKSVSTATASLARKGLLTIPHRGCKGSGPSTYRVTLPV